MTHIFSAIRLVIHEGVGCFPFFRDLSLFREALCAVQCILPNNKRIFLLSCHDSEASSY